MPHVRLHRFLREEEALADLAVDKAVCNELQHLDLTRSRLLGELAEDRRIERDHSARAARAAPGSCCFETAAVIAVTAEDFLALCCVHGISYRRRPAGL